MQMPFSPATWLQIRCLGGCDLRCSDGPVRFESNKVRALLIYLAMNPGLHERHKLMGLLWGDHSEDRARRNLRHSLWNLRRRLDRDGATFLLFEGETVAFNPESDYWLDVEAFRRAARGLVLHAAGTPFPESLEAVLDLYRGNFLEGFYVRDALAFDEWALIEREHLQAMARVAFESLVQAYLRAGDYRSSRISLERLLTIDPWREEVHRQLMCLLALSDERTAALSQYRQCCSILRKELGVDPLAETTALYHKIRDGNLGHDEAAAALFKYAQRPATIEPPPPGNLPAPTTAFFGREAELSFTSDCLEGHGCRLLTLTGPPGVGKTRLALELGARLATRRPPPFPDGIFFVSLAPLTSARDLLAAVVEALPAQPSGRTSLDDWLQRYLHNRKLLLILDNFEHLIPAATQVSALLAACPHLKVLITSRELLHLRGEHDYPVPPLPLPDTAALADWQSLEKCPPVALFADRSQAVSPTFRLTADNAHTVARICKRLDGLPLAIELAAARTKVLSTTQLLRHIGTGEDGTALALLTSGVRDLPARHHALGSAIAWSYDLLDEKERVLLTRLAVFADGCTLDAAEAVVSTSRRPLAELLDGLSSLLDKSLLRLLPSRAGDRRYGMLVTIREFALDRLQARGERDAVERRCAAYYLALAETAEEGMKGSEQANWTNRIEDELGNLRAVHQHALARADVTFALRLGAALARFWQRHGGATEGRRWLKEALARPEAMSAPLPVRAKGLWAAGLLAWHQRSTQEARELLEESLCLCRDMDDSAGVARALNDLGAVAMGSGHLENARLLLEESMTLHKQHGNTWGLATALGNLGTIAGSRGEFAKAASLLEESLALRRSLGDTTGLAYDLSNLGLTTRYLGDLDGAVALYDESLALLTGLEHKPVRTAVLSNLADIERSLGRFDRAWSCYREGLSLCHETGEKESFAVSLEGLGRVAANRGDSTLAAQLLGAASRLREEIGVPLPEYRRETYAEIISTISTHLGKQGLEAALRAGKQMSMDKVIAVVKQVGTASCQSGREHLK